MVISNWLRNGRRGVGSDRYRPLQSGYGWSKKRQTMRYVTIDCFLKDFFSKRDPICSFLQLWSRLLKKILMKDFIYRVA